MCWSSRSAASSCSDEVEKRYLEFIKAELAPRYAEFVGKRSRRPISNPMRITARICLTVTLIMRTPGSRIRISRIPDTGQLLNRELLNQELTKIEKPAGIANLKTSCNEVVKFSRSRAHNSSRN